jgi:hypothetical protein
MGLPIRRDSHREVAPSLEIVHESLSAVAGIA